MPKRTDIKSILVLGAGPIVIGQACEFDYSGTQVCRTLKQEGYRIILVNSNPATIMTDIETAAAVYIEPLEWKTVARIIERERPDALLPTMGGQTALNCAMDLQREGILEKYGVEMIGSKTEAIDMAEDRDKFRKAMDDIGLQSARSFIAHNMDEAHNHIASLGFPLVVRPSFTLGGSGGGIVYNREEFDKVVWQGFSMSPMNSVLLEESLLGWKEFEMEVVRDKKDNCIIVCSIENVDPMGVHTGDSITVAPALTLTDKEYQLMRDAAIAVLRKIGVETGGSNVQFALHPDNGRMIVIEMNPRVSRSSALASKATGFPIAKVAAKLAVGYTLDELQNEITQGATPASFEPSIDYIVTKVPRFTFEKLPQAKNKLGTQMQSIGEVMAIGRTFPESLQKALCGLDYDIDGLTPVLSDNESEQTLHGCLSTVRSDRLLYIAEAFRHEWSIDKVHNLTAIDPWFLSQISELIKMEKQIEGRQISDLSVTQLRTLKRAGFSDTRLATLLNCDAAEVVKHRIKEQVLPVFKRVDTCAAEFDTATAYLYSSFEEECEGRPSNKRKVMILGGGPNRIGQGLEFDCCCVHATQAWQELGLETIMVNCNPETVSTDYDMSDRLYFEPLTFEHVMNIVRLEAPVSVAIQYGGQTPLKLARQLDAAGVPILGTSPDAIDLAEDRGRFQSLLKELNLRQPPNDIVMTTGEAMIAAGKLGYPIVVRPSYVLGGRAMEIVHNDAELETYIHAAVAVSEQAPLLLDRFLNDAIEVDVDAVCDGTDVFIGGIMEHIEEAGIHSGDSACSLPPYSLSDEICDELRRQTVMLAKALNIVGLMNIQFAIRDRRVYVLEVNPRASRTVPFVSKAIGLPLAKIAAKCMTGVTLAEQNLRVPNTGECFMVKESVFPFLRFSDVDPMLGPEMLSTGEVMGIGRDFGEAFYKAQLAAGNPLPSRGKVFISVCDKDKKHVPAIGTKLLELGFDLCATTGTSNALNAADIPCEIVYKVTQGRRPHIVDHIKDGDIALVINTAEDAQSVADSFTIRREALQNSICYTTTIAGARAIIAALQSSKQPQRKVYRLQSDIPWE